MIGQIMIPKIVNPSCVIDVLDKYRVEIMIYDSHQDSHWIQFFKESPLWEIISEDHEAVVFTKRDKIQTIR
jgi:hypothetical protein